MSDDILTAEDDYLQSPVDDLFSFYYTLQWAVVFHDREFSTKEDVPSKLEKLREYLLGNRGDRLSTTVQFASRFPLRPREYGSVVAKCHPLLRAWNSELEDLRVDWLNCQYELGGHEAKAEIYQPLFLTLAVRGVAAFAELVYKYTKDMDDMD